MTRGLILALCFGLSACAKTPAERTGVFVPVSTGLLVVDSDGQEIGFGRHMDGALNAAQRLKGLAVISGDTCTRAAWQDGLVIWFEDQTFVGWSKGGQSAGRICG